MDTSTCKTHPLIIAAAIAVIVACVAIVANLSGLLPGKSAPESPSTTSAPPPTGEAATPTSPAPGAGAPTGTRPATRRQRHPGAASGPAAVTAPVDLP